MTIQRLFYHCAFTVIGLILIMAGSAGADHQGQLQMIRLEGFYFETG